MVSKKDLDIIVSDLKELAKKDTMRAIKVERIITENLKNHSEKYNDRANFKGLVRETYEDLRMRDDLDKTNSKKVDKSFLKASSRIGRIDRKKAWHNLIYHINKNLFRLNFKELNHVIADIEKKITLPEDYDISQTAKIRDEFIFLKDNKVNFHVLEDSQDAIKKIALKDNSIIILGRNIVYRINIDTKEIDSDTPSALGLMPLDTIIYVSGQFAFIWKR